MKHISIAAVVGVVAALTAASGLLHGKLTQRWGPSVDVAAAAKLLEETPSQFGPWREAAREDLDPSVKNTLQCAGYVNRIYVHESTGEQVHVAVLIGPPGPTSVHIPEVCFASRAYTPSGKRQVETIEETGRKDDFWTLTFRGTGLRGDYVRIWYAWGVGDHWVASDEPRLKFAGRPYLYKIQLSSPSATGDKEDDTCRKFLLAFLPELQRRLKAQTAS